MASSHHKILIKPRAEEDLKNIYSYSLQEFGIKKARQYVKNLDEVFRKISENPNLGSHASYVKSKLIFYRSTSHLIFYQITNSSVTIIRILHKSMDFEKYFNV
jgi:toxin ParE1/3/4